ncbi:MAG TPA: hypothetical protein VN577_00990 [Terriglobales bacterium]|nr:hypothetical protein [Terriglobales bacterium]
MNFAKTAKWAMRAILMAFLLTTITGVAQVCTGIPDFPDNTVTATQDRDHMMCQLGVAFPVLPVRQGTAWPWNDPTAPTNAWPRNQAAPEGNWTDAQGHTVVRTAWGNWHTYDSEPQFNPPADVHYPDVAATYKGGAMTGVGDYGPGSNPRYPDIELLEMKDGTPVSVREDWWMKRRPEIFNFVQQQLYGTTLLDFKPNITWSVVPANPASGTQNGSDGQPYAYTAKVITGTIDTSSYPALRHIPRITATCRLPSATIGTKVPVVVVFGGATAFQYTAPYGYGVCGLSQTQIQPDNGNQGALSSYLIGLKNQGNWRKPDDPGALVAWAWGVSRLIDYFETDPDIDGDKVGVEGHSRNGKATLVAAAYDQRVVAAYPSCGGSLGTSWARRAYGETLDFVSSSSSEYHWVTGNIMKYAGPINPYGPRENQFPRKVQNLDVDTHSMMSLIAPRAVFTNGGTDNSNGNGDAWQDPRGMYLAGAVSGPVWEFLGWPGQIIPEGTLFTTSTGYVYPATCANNTTSGRSVCDPSAESVGGTPPFDVPFIEGTVGYRRHKEGHTDAPDWPSFALFANRYFKDARPVVTADQSFVLGNGPMNVVGTVAATDADAGDTLKNWQVKGGSGAYTFVIDSDSGQITIANASAIDFFSTPSYSLTVMVGDGKLPSHDQTVTIAIPTKVTICHKPGKISNTLSILKTSVPDHLAHGDAIGSCTN